MRGPHLRSTGKSVIAILCAVCFLAMSLGSVSRVVADDTWETWPKKTTMPGVERSPKTDADGAAKAGEATGKETSKETAKETAKGTAKGRSYGTIGWIALGIAAAIGIAIAAGGSGGGSGGTTNPGHH